MLKVDNELPILTLQELNDLLVLVGGMITDRHIPPSNVDLGETKKIHNKYRAGWYGMDFCKLKRKESFKEGRRGERTKVAIAPTFTGTRC